MKKRTLLIASIVGLISASAAVFAQSPGVNNNFPITWTMVWENASTKPTYSATRDFAPATAATDVCGITGSASKVIRVRQVVLGGVATAVATEEVTFFLRSTANAAGGAAMLPASYDTQNAAQTAITDFWTANPTTGLPSGEIAELFLTWANTTTGVGSTLVYDFGSRNGGSSVVLRGAAQSLNVNLNQQTMGASARISCTFVWTEE